MGLGDKIESVYHDVRIYYRVTIVIKLFRMVDPIVKVQLSKTIISTCTRNKNRTRTKLTLFVDHLILDNLFYVQFSTLITFLSVQYCLSGENGLPLLVYISICKSSYWIFIPIYDLHVKLAPSIFFLQQWCNTVKKVNWTFKITFLFLIIPSLKQYHGQ